MKNNNLCCRIFPVVLILISFILALAIWYFVEDIHNFQFLLNKNKIFNFSGTALFIAIPPISIFYLFSGKEGFERKAKWYSFPGFIPAIIFLLYTILS